MLTFVGLGLYDERSITLEGRDALRSADRVFAEFYTSRLAGATVDDLESFHGVDTEVRDRAGVEQQAEPILEAGEDGDAVFLTAGDTMISTTHVDLRLRAAERGIETRVVHGTTAEAAAASLTGLQNYRFGKATTLPFPYAHGGRAARAADDERAARAADDERAARAADDERAESASVPGSVVDTVTANRERGLHTLVYLDIKVGTGPRGPDPDHEEYMTGDRAAELLAEELGADAVGVVVARAGGPDPVVAADALGSLADREFGDPLHLLVLPGDLHVVERDALVELAGAPGDALPDPV